MNMKVISKSIPGMLLASAIVVMSSCSTRSAVDDDRRGPHPTPKDVVELTRAGRPTDEIIWQIRTSPDPYVLDAKEVRDLLQQGVDEKVVNAMLQNAHRDQGYEHLRLTHPETYLPPPFRNQGAGQHLP